MQGNAFFAVVKQRNHGADVVAAQHGAQQLRGFFARDQGAFFAAMGHSGQIAGLDLGRRVHTGGNAVGDQLDQKSLFALRRVFQQLNDFTGLLGRQRQGRNADDSALGNVAAVGWQEMGGFIK